MNAGDDASRRDASTRDNSPPHGREPVQGAGAAPCVRPVRKSSRARPDRVPSTKGACDRQGRAMKVYTVHLPKTARPATPPGLTGPSSCATASTWLAAAVAAVLAAPPTVLWVVVCLHRPHGNGGDRCPGGHQDHAVRVLSMVLQLRLVWASACARAISRAGPCDGAGFRRSVLVAGRDAEEAERRFSGAGSSADRCHPAAQPACGRPAP